jgi:hypothetical protein
MIREKTMFQGQIGFALALMWIAAFGFAGVLSQGLLYTSDARFPTYTREPAPSTQWVGLKAAVFGRDAGSRREAPPARIIKTAAKS